MTAHLNDIKSYDPAPDKVFSAGTTGEYTWGSFMNAVGAYAAMSGKRTLGNHDLAREVGQIGLLEYRLREPVLTALRRAGLVLCRDLNSNPVCKSQRRTARAVAAVARRLVVL